MSSMVCGHPVSDLMDLVAHIEAQGFSSVREYIDALKEPEEYAATVSLLKARLQRISRLTEVTV